MTLPRLLQTFLIALLLSSCINNDSPTDAAPLGQSSFSAYQQQTRQWLDGHRRFVSQNRQAELTWNAPQEWQPAGKPRGGILLVHGLGDSPYSFADIAPRLAAKGFVVRALLLPGHGTKPADLLQIELVMWQRVVKEQTALMRREFNHMVLGGFSTGANLVINEAASRGDIRALLLFSPALKANSQIDWLAPLLSSVYPWRRAPDGPDQQTAVRYLNVPTNGIGQYYYSSKAVRNVLNNQGMALPVLMVLAQQDGTIDARYALEHFPRQFSHPASRVLWYGQAPAKADPRILSRSDNLPQAQIRQFSHMSVLFTPDNPLYGRSGSLRMCPFDLPASQLAFCQRSNQVWYAERGHEESGKVFARLTFNPHFEWQDSMMQQVLDTAVPH